MSKWSNSKEWEARFLLGEYDNFRCFAKWQTLQNLLECLEVKGKCGEEYPTDCQINVLNENAKGCYE